MKLLISTGYGETSMEATPERIHSALHPVDDIDYGTSFSLESSEGMSLVAICISSVRLPPNEEGEFLLGLANGESYRECSKRFTRSQIAEYLNKFLAEDQAWVSNFEWDEA